jgi:hypothetical protein
VVRHINRKAGASNYGRYIVLEHPAESPPVYTLYAHLAEVAPGVAPGGAAVPPSFPAPALLHGAHSAACIDLAQQFATPLALLNVTLQWRRGGEGGGWVDLAPEPALAHAAAFSATTLPSPAAPAQATSLTWAPSDPPRWGPSLAASHAQSEVTNTRVVLFSWGTIAIVIVQGIVQVWYLYSFFRRRKFLN